jgi:hypothetical protein
LLVFLGTTLIRKVKFTQDIFGENLLFMKKRIANRSKTVLPLSKLGQQFTGHENHHITLQEASVLTKTYRQQHPNKPIAEFFGRDALLAILSQPNCVGIRIYYGTDPKSGQPHLVLVGAEPNKNDIDHGIIAERGILCPSCCGKPNRINS